MSKKILAIDIGYGDTKVVYGDDTGNIIKKFKIPTLIGIVGNNTSIVKDDKIIAYAGNSYYVGEDVYSLESSRIIDINDYSHLEFFAPIICHYVCTLIKDRPDIVVTGLSKAQLENSGHFQKKLESYEVNGQTYEFNKVVVLPQGVPSKLTIEKYGINYPKSNTDYHDKSSYLCIDVGFNTLDLFQVINGETSANLAEGIEQHGIVKLAQKVKSLVATDERFNRTISLKEAKHILDSNSYKLRGATYDLTEECSRIKSEYLADLTKLVESKYGTILDNMDAFYLIGGGSIIFRDMNDSFIKVPAAENEFYNVLGFFLRFAS